MSRLRSIVQRTFGDEIMNSWKYLLAAATTAVVLNFSLAAPSDVAVPRGWVASGDFGRHFLTEQRTEPTLGAMTALFSHVRVGEKFDSVFSIVSLPTASDRDRAVVSYPSDVSKYQNNVFHFTFFFKQEGGVQKKDAWVRFFDQNGQIQLTQFDLPLEAAEKSPEHEWVPVMSQFRVPMNARKMEIGFGQQGKGRFEIRNLTLMPLAVSFSNEERTSLSSVARTPAEVQALNPRAITVGE